MPYEGELNIDGLVTLSDSVRAEEMIAIGIGRKYFHAWVTVTRGIRRRMETRG